MPAETRAFVRIVTGHDVEVWATCVADAGQAGRTECPKHMPALPVTRPKEHLSRTDQAEWAPWGLQLIGDWSEARALTDYRKLQLRFPHVLGRAEGAGAPRQDGWARLRTVVPVPGCRKQPCAHRRVVRAARAGRG